MQGADARGRLVRFNCDESSSPPTRVWCSLAMPIVVYELRDATGILVAFHDRHDQPDGSKRFAWRRPDGTAGLRGVPLVDLPLYGIDRLDGLATTVVLVEGEKCAEALWSLEIPAVATVTGAATVPSAAVLTELTGRRVYLWPDNDDVGHKHMERVAAGLVGIAADVRAVTWPDAPEHGDAADFLAAGGTREDVDALVNGALPLPPAVSSPGPAPTGLEAWEPAPSLDRSAGLPAFPAQALPPSRSTYAKAQAEAEAVANQTPPDMAAMFGLAGWATVAGGRPSSPARRSFAA